MSADKAMMLTPAFVDYAGRALLAALALWCVGYGIYRLWNDHIRNWLKS